MRGSGIYGTLSMPATLSKAHDLLDKVVDTIMAPRRRLTTDADRLAVLFERYARHSLRAPAGIRPRSPAHGDTDRGAREPPKPDRHTSCPASIEPTDALHTWTLMDDRREKPKGLLGRWDNRNQRIVERQNRNGLRRDKDRAETHFNVVSADGKPLTVWAQPSGYPFRFGDGGGDWLDFVILPGMWALALLRHRYEFRRGWSVAVIANGRVFEKIIRLERFASKQEAKARAAQLSEELVGHRKAEAFCDELRNQPG